MIIELSPLDHHALESTFSFIPSALFCSFEMFMIPDTEEAPIRDKTM